MICKRCETDKGVEFYANDRTCKECRKALVRANRLKRGDQYREYDRQRYRNNPDRREAINQYLKTDKGREVANAAKRRWIHRNQHKRAAHIIAGNAIRDGRLAPQPCEQCGEPKTDAHHDDYGQPLNVRWLCRKCHAREHGRK